VPAEEAVFALCLPKKSSLIVGRVEGSRGTPATSRRCGDGLGAFVRRCGGGLGAFVLWVEGVAGRRSCEAEGAHLSFDYCGIRGL